MSTSRKNLLSLHMMVLNGAAVLDRALRPLKGFIDEISFVDTGSTDGTPEKITSLATDLNVPCHSVLLSPKTHPGLYFIDSQSSFRRQYPSSFFSGLPLLKDWSVARNLALENCTSKYIMKLDADDEVMSPEKMPAVLSMLDASPEVDVLLCTYEIMDGHNIDEVSSVYTRFWRNYEDLKFTHAFHEDVDFRRVEGTNWRVVLGDFIFRDWRDSPGVGARVSHRNFKVLLREYERLISIGQTVDLHILSYLAREALDVDPGFTVALLDHHISGYSPRAQSVLHMVRGEGFHRLGQLEESLECLAFAASGENVRADLLHALLSQELGLPGWRDRLSSAHRRAKENIGLTGIKRCEMDKAKALLSGDAP